MITIETSLTSGNKPSWIATVWEAIHAAEEAHPDCDEAFDEVKTAMAWITEEITPGPVHTDRRCTCVYDNWGPNAWTDPDCTFHGSTVK